MGDFLAYELLPIILNMTLTASIVIVLVLLARLVLRRAPRICSYALWLVVLFRLLCPVSLTADISLMGLLDTPVTEVTAHTSAAAYVPRDVVHNPEPSVKLPVPGMGEAITEALPQGEEQTVADPLEAPVAIATIIWMAGTAAMVIYGVVSLLRLRRRLVGAVPLEKGVYLADHIETPFVLGLFRPKIYLPSALPEGERGYILLHERHHIRRLDHVVKLLAFLSLCIHWFNPLVWIMFVLLGRDMEMSCDEAVMKKLGEAVRTDYSASLLRLATGRRFSAGAPLAFGEGDTRDRVVNVLKWKRPRLWAVLAGVAACVAVIAACAVNPGVRTAGQYASMEDYIQQQMELKKRDVYHSSSGLLRDMEEGETVSVTDARASQVEKQGELEDLAPEGTLEAWTYQYRVRLDAPEENVLLLGNQTVEDGWYDLEGRGEHHVAALRYPDGSYDILCDDPANEDLTFYNGDYDSWEEALFDWYVREQGLDLPLYVEDWRDRLDLPDGDGGERYPVHRYDGDGWYLYVPLSTWDNVSPSDTGGAWIWRNVCGIGWVAVQRFNQPLSVRQALARELGMTPVDSTEQIWQSGDEFIRCLYDDPGGGSWQVDADWSGADSSDSPYAKMAPRVMALIAESFTLDERITATVKPRLTLAAVQALAEQKGELLSWADFEDYTYTETGSGLYIRDYPIDGSFSLRIGGGWLDEEPMYIYLNCGEDFIDIRREDVDAFIRRGQAVQQGAELLSNEEVTQYNERFQSIVYDKQGNPVENNVLCCFLTSLYDDVTELNFEEFLRYFPGDGSQTSEAEFQALKNVEIWPFDWVGTLADNPVPVHRYPRRLVDLVLEEYAGITTADLDTSAVAYLPEYDAYYNYTSDSGLPALAVTWGCREGDLIRLYQETGDRTLELTLREVDDRGSWHFVSFRSLEGT